MTHFNTYAMVLEPGQQLHPLNCTLVYTPSFQQKATTIVCHGSLKFRPLSIETLGWRVASFGLSFHNFLSAQGQI